MKEKTRKILAIGLIWLSFGVQVCNLIASVFYWDILYEMGYSLKDLTLLFNIAPLLLLVGSLVGSVLILRKLLNRVTRSFFYRSVAWCVLEFIVVLTVWLSNIDSNDLMEIIWFFCNLLTLLLIMSGAGMLSQNYTMSAYIASKLRLFQTGVVLIYGRVLVFRILWWLRGSFFYSPLETINTIISWIGIICMILGMIGIIKSDLVSESCKGDVFGQIDGGWLSRPVIGVVCFVGLLTCFVFFLPEFITL